MLQDFFFNRGFLATNFMEFRISNFSDICASIGIYQYYPIFMDIMDLRFKSTLSL